MRARLANDTENPFSNSFGQSRYVNHTNSAIGW